MNTRPVGRAGFTVSEIGFGAWPIGGAGRNFHYGDVSESDALACLETYVGQGGTFLDTARAYNRSEEILGRFLARPDLRDRIVVASKTGQPTEEGIRAELDESRRALRRDVIDLYYLHHPPDDPDEMNRTLDVYERLQAEGKIRAIGASVKGPDVTPATVTLCRQYIRTGRVDALQVIYSILRQENAAMFEEARAAGVAIVARTTLENGFLTGKYEPDRRFSGQDHRKRFTDEQLGKILREARRLKETAVAPPFQTLGQTAIRFVLDHPAVSVAIVGAKSPQQTRENMSPASLPPLPENLRRRLVETYANRCGEFNTTA